MLKVHFGNLHESHEVSNLRSEQNMLNLHLTKNLIRDTLYKGKCVCVHVTF